MASAKYQLPVTLETEDSKILEVIVATTGESRNAVLRWALRFYSLRGPWVRSKRDRIEAIGSLEHGPVGPIFEEAI